MTSLEIFSLFSAAVVLAAIPAGICVCVFYLRRIVLELRAIRKVLQARSSRCLTSDEARVYLKDISQVLTGRRKPMGETSLRPHR